MSRLLGALGRGARAGAWLLASLALAASPVLAADPSASPATIADPSGTIARNSPAGRSRLRQ